MPFPFPSSLRRSLLAALVALGVGACGAAPGLPALPVAAQEQASAAGAGGTRYLVRAGGKIAYDDVGTGPVVLCAPSLGDLRAEYRFLKPQLLAAGYRVVTMDLRGLGESSTGWEDYSVAGVGADMLALARHLNAGPVTLIGDSMAGGAAVWAAAEGPELVHSLVLIDAFVRSPDPGWVSRAIATVFSGFWGAGLWGDYYKSLYPSAPPEDFEVYLAKLRANLAEPGRLEAVREMLAASKSAAEERLSRVQAPTLVLMGTRDPDFPDPAAEGRFIAERLQAKLHLIEGAGHYPHAEMPALTGPVISDFLKQTRAGKAQGS